MLLRHPVLALEEEGAGQFEAHPDQRGIGDQHLAEDGDGLVKQLAAAIAFRGAGFLHRNHALAEQGVKILVLSLRGKGEQKHDGK